MKLFQINDELPAEELRHDLDRKEEAFFARLPITSAFGQSSSGNDVMDMGMVHEILSPRVQDADKPDLGSQALWVLRKFCQGFRNGLEQDGVEDFLIPEDKRIEQIGDGEDDVEVRYGEQVFSPVFDPPFFFEELALGTVPVSAGVVRDQFRAAVPAFVHVAALVRGATDLDRPHDAQPTRRHGMSAPAPRTVPAEDIRDLKLFAVPHIHDKPPRARGITGLEAY